MESQKSVTDISETNYGTKTPSGKARIFNCDKCKRAFTREEHLTRHILSTHNKLKPFTCGICSRPFSRRDLLLRHAKNLHGGSEQAVSRIRKSFKRGDHHQAIVKVEAGTSGTFLEYGQRHYDSNISHSENSQMESPRTNSAVQVENSSMTISTLDYDTPEKKRMKMSVNMLVS